jgi:hypothetical protein
MNTSFACGTMLRFRVFCGGKQSNPSSFLFRARDGPQNPSGNLLPYEAPQERGFLLLGSVASLACTAPCPLTENARPPSAPDSVYKYAVSL